jgi:hypothetical protein
MGVLSWIEKYNDKFGFKQLWASKLNIVLSALYLVRGLAVSPAARREFDYCVLDPFDLLSMTDLFILCITLGVYSHNATCHAVLSEDVA